LDKTEKAKKTLNKRKRLEFNDIYDRNSSFSDISNIQDNINSNNIQELQIDGVLKIDNLILSYLKRNKSLQSLIIRNIDFGKYIGEINAIKIFLETNTSLAKLEIDFSNIVTKTEGINSCPYYLNLILEAIIKNEYNINLNYISFSDCHMIPSYQMLYFDQTMARLLKSKNHLHVLKLQNIGLTDDNIEKMSENLIYSNIEELDISNNKDVSDIGGKAIVEALKQNVEVNKLRKINVINTNISSKIKREMEKYVLVIGNKPWKYMKELEIREERYGYRV